MEENKQVINRGLSDDTRIRFKFLISNIIPLMVFGVILFVSSGRTDWIFAWAVLGTGLAYILAVIFIINPSLLNERIENPSKKGGTKKWDMAILNAINLLLLLSALVAGLSMRFGWPGHAPLFVQVAGTALFIIGYTIFFWAMVSNDFFSMIVRIQEDRGHTVTNSGPYRRIRHPGYLGMIVYSLAMPLMLGSFWALAPVAVSIMLLIIRTSLEDKALQKELTGYKEYMQYVQYRLFPGIW